MTNGERLGGPQVVSLQCAVWGSYLRKSNHDMKLLRVGSSTLQQRPSVVISPSIISSNSLRAAYT